MTENAPTGIDAARLTLRPREAAAALGIGERTLRELIRSGAIESIRLRRAVLIPRASLEAFIAARLGREGDADAR